MLTENTLNQIYEKIGLCDYDVMQKINGEVWKTKYDSVMHELLNPETGFRTTALHWGDEKKFWKPNREIINYGVGSIYIDESKEQNVTRQKKRKHPTGHLYSVTGKKGNVWITEDELNLYRKTKNAWAKDTHDWSLANEVFRDDRVYKFVNSYYLSHFANLFRIPKRERPCWKNNWEEVWRFHRVKDAPKFLKV